MDANRPHKILWLNINSSYAHSSLALPAIEAQSCFYNHNIEWDIVSGTLKSNISSVVAEIVEKQADILCFTSWLFTHKMLIEIISRVKTIAPNLIIIGGGPEYLGDNKLYLERNLFIDFIIRGEGEEVFYHWLNAFTNREDFGKISGLCYIDKNGNYIDNGIAKVLDITTLNYPEDSPFFDWEKPFIQLETTRGCFNSCEFCISGGDKPVRSISLEEVEKRIKKVADKGIKEVRLLDRTFNGNTTRALGLLNIFEKFDNISFHLEVHPALINKTIIDKIGTLPQGKLHLEAGIQSLSEEVLEKCGRKGEASIAFSGLKSLCAIENIIVHTDLIAGLPGYKLEGIYSDVAKLASVGAAEIQLETLKLLPGTPMRNNAKAKGIKYSPEPPYEVLQTESISARELLNATSLSRILDFYYNTESWHNIFKKLIINNSSFLKEFTEYLQQNENIYAPLSLEKRGILLYRYICDHFPKQITDFKIEWINNGLPLRKEPTSNLVSSDIQIDKNDTIVFGEDSSKLRKYHFCDSKDCYIFGFNREESHCKPIFMAIKSLTVVGRG